MPTVLQFRRGSTAQNDAFTGSGGEISVDTDKNVLRVHDGSTLGGQELVGATVAQTLTNKTLVSPSITTALNTGSTTVGLFDTTATTVNAFGASTTTNIGYDGTSSNFTINVGTGALYTLVGNYTKTINIATGGTTGSISDINLGSTVAGTLTVNNPTAVFQSSSLDINSTTIDMSAGTSVTIGAASGTLTIQNPTLTASSSNTEVKSLGVGTAGSGTTGEIRATNQIVAYYSDERLKENIELIESPIEKVMQLRGVTYTPNALAESYGYTRDQKHVGVIAQDVKQVLPEAVQPAPFDRMIIEGMEISRSGQNYMTVQYERIVPLLIEAIKDQQRQIEALKAKIGE